MRRFALATCGVVAFFAAVMLALTSSREHEDPPATVPPASHASEERDHPRTTTTSSPGEAGAETVTEPMRAAPPSQEPAESSYPRIRDKRDFPKLAWHLNEQDFLLELHKGHVGKMRFFGEGMKPILIRTPEQVALATQYAHDCDTCEVLEEEYIANTILDGTYTAIYYEKEEAKAHSKKLHKSKVVDVGTRYAVVDRVPLYESEEYVDAIEARKESLRELGARTGHYRALNETERSKTP